MHILKRPTKKSWNIFSIGSDLALKWNAEIKTWTHWHSWNLDFIWSRLLYDSSNCEWYSDCKSRSCGDFQVLLGGAVVVVVVVMVMHPLHQTDRQPHLLPLQRLHLHHQLGEQEAGCWVGLWRVGGAQNPTRNYNARNRLFTCNDQNHSQFSISSKYLGSDSSYLLILP